RMETTMITFRTSKRTLAMTAVSTLLGLTGCAGQPGGGADLGQAAEADTGAGSWQETPVNYGVSSTVDCVGMRTEASGAIGLMVSTDQRSVMINSLSLLGTGATTNTSTSLTSGQSKTFQAQDASGDVLDATVSIGSDTSGNLTIAFSAPTIVTPWWSGSLAC